MGEIVLSNKISALLENRLDDFHMPRYNELPSIEVYMDQLLTLIELALSPLYGDNSTKWVTTSMINNYIKQGVIKKTHSKRYDKEHIASLIYVFAVKNVMAISDIQTLFALQQQTYPMERAYNYFCREFEAALKAVFKGEEMPSDSASEKGEESFILRFSAVAAAHQIFLNEYLKEFRKEN